MESLEPFFIPLGSGKCGKRRVAALVRWPGFEPGLGPWQGPVIPLHHQRSHTPTVDRKQKGSETRDIHDSRRAFDLPPVRESSVAADVAAAVAAHEAVEADRVSIYPKIDDKRTAGASAREKVEHVEQHPGQEARSDP